VNTRLGALEAHDSPKYVNSTVTVHNSGHLSDYGSIIEFSRHHYLDTTRCQNLHSEVESFRCVGVY